MGKLRSLGCWEVLPRSSLPQNASVMKSRWTFRYKTNELGNLKPVSHRSRFVAKGYSSTRSALLRELRSSCLLHNVTFTLRTHKHSKTWCTTTRRICWLLSKQTRLKPSTSLLWMCRRMRRSTQIRLSSSSPSVRHERQSSRMGSTIRKRLHRLRTNTPQKRRMRLRKIRQQFKDSNPTCATKPGKYYRSHCSRTRKREDLFGLSACYSDD